MTNLKVLIVDDSLVTAKKLTLMLEDLGHRVVGNADSGARAVDAYRACAPDLVTMDVTMPDMDGIMATRRIIDEFPRANIIMVTSHGQERMVIDALCAGARGYVLKPLRREKLAEMIDRAVGCSTATPGSGSGRGQAEPL